MKKIFFVVALLVVVASCTKNEVIPQNDGNNEITYLTAPLTKATSSFGTSNKFYSYAYLVTSGNWAGNSASSSLYINEAEIWYQTPEWKANQSYYWPKNDGSSLTFFAWSNGTGTLVDAIGECSNTKGVQFPNYNVSDLGNKNKDMMVAKIVADQKANTNSGVVPTLFYHVLSSLDIRAQRAKDYDSTTFKIVSIKFNNVSVEGSYVQGINASALPTAGAWTESNPKKTKNLDVYTPDAATKVDGLATATPQTFTSLTPDDYSIFLPHTLVDAETVTIVYTINNGLSTETVTVTKSLKEIFGSWEAGKKYMLTITLSLNEILWDPAVEEWEPGTGTWGI